ncbi:MAG: carboxypeptidase regulatory-like domain-containing protein [Sciscionella sp.]
MRREIRFAVASLPRRQVLSLAAWSVPEALPAALSGLAIAKSVDKGFLAGEPVIGLVWLAGFVVSGVIGAVGARQVYRRLGDVVEPFRDDLVRRVVGGSLRHGVAGRAEDGAVARLTRQVEIVRDTYAGLIVLLNNFIVTVVGVVLGLLSIAPIIVALLVPPFLLGFGAFAATLGLAASRQRTAIRAEERLAAAAGSVLAGTRDVVALGAEEHAAALVAEPVGEQAAAERALARVATLRALCFAIGGWGPLVVLLVAGPWLVSQGLTAGAIMGGLTYVLFGLQPALRAVHAGLGSAGLRFVVTLGRILDASSPPEPRTPTAETTSGYELSSRGLTFAYGPHAEPVLRDLDLTVPQGDHLAIVGPSGIGKSTLAGLLCGLLSPDSGVVRLGGAPAVGLPAETLAGVRVLIPQEAYVFSSTLWNNVTYLRPSATPAQVEHAVHTVGAKALIERLGGYPAELAPTELSAGERQLLALVRAYLSPAPLVVLDEATCHLDPVAERRAEEAFAERGGTLIVIAHRISSALRARRILVLDGVSQAVGDHKTLLATSPLYRELLGHWKGGAERPAQDTDPDTEPIRVNPMATNQCPVLFGQISWANGAPLAGATMTLTDLCGRQMDRRRADAQGRYRLAAPAHGTYLLICASPAHRPQASVVSVTAEVPVRHDVTLHTSTSSLSGTVRTDGAHPRWVGAAVVTLIHPGGDVTAATTTGSSGEFHFADLTGGSYTLTVNARNIRPVAHAVTVPSGTDVRHHVEVAAVGKLMGRVRSASAGTPVGEALATLTDENGDVIDSKLTGADGEFAFHNLAPGSYTVTASGYQQMAATVEIGAGEATEAVLALRPPSRPDRIEIGPAERTIPGGRTLDQLNPGP